MLTHTSNQTHDKFENAVLESVYWAGLWDGGPAETAPFVNEIESIKATLIAEGANC